MEWLAGDALKAIPPPRIGRTRIKKGNFLISAHVEWFGKHTLAKPADAQNPRLSLPVTVYYTKVGDRLVASRAVVRKTTTVTPASPAIIEKKTSTTTTTEGKK